MKPGPGTMEARLLRHEGFIVNAAKRFYRYYHITMGPSVDFQDLIQEYRIAALRALRNFDPARGASECTFISAYLNRTTKHLIAYTRVKKRQAPGEYVLSLDQIVFEDGATMADLIIDESRRGPEAEAWARISIKEYLRGLHGSRPDRMRAVVEARARGATLEETALAVEGLDRRPISRQRISQIEAMSIRQMRVQAGIEEEGKKKRGQKKNRARVCSFTP